MRCARWTGLARPLAARVDVVWWQVARSRASSAGQPTGWGHDSEAAWQDLLPLLSAEEQARAQRFVFAQHRIAYVQAHARMRQLLASYSGVARERLLFEVDSRGKPRLQGNAGGRVHFNLSHTDGVCALALCGESMEVGIDVERLRPVEREVAEYHFSVGEREQLVGLEGSQWEQAFFRCWTRKEAILKAEGVGLRVPLASFDVSLLPGERAALLASRAAAHFTCDWSLHHFEPLDAVIGAVACPGTAEVVFYHAE